MFESCLNNSADRQLGGCGILSSPLETQFVSCALFFAQNQFFALDAMFMHEYSFPIQCGSLLAILCYSMGIESVMVNFAVDSFDCVVLSHAASSRISPSMEFQDKQFS